MARRYDPERQQRIIDAAIRVVGEKGIAGLSHRTVAAEWAHDLADRLSHRTDPVTARALVALMDGICLQVLLTEAPYDEEYARDVLRRMIP